MFIKGTPVSRLQELAMQLPKFATFKPKGYRWEQPPRDAKLGVFKLLMFKPRKP
jgi:hypothetical protein